jgi:hypothetical protein
LGTSEFESDSAGVLATVGVASSLDTCPVDPITSLAPVGWIVLLGATPVGAANGRGLDGVLLVVGNTMVSGTGPVEPTVLAAVLNVGDKGLLGISPVGAAALVRSLPVLATEEDSEKVGEASSVSGRRPVDATRAEVVGADDVTSEAIVGETSSVLGRRPVEATKVDSVGADALAIEEAKVGEGSSVSGN